MWPDNPDDLARLFYFGILLVAASSIFLWGQRQRLGRTLQQFAIWALIFVMVIIAYGFRDTLRAALFPASMIQISQGIYELQRGADGHFHADLRVNGADIRFVIDTGATGIVLSRKDAGAAGIDVDALAFLGRALTANGPVATADVRLGLVEFGEDRYTGIRASVNAGELDVSLLGMAYLDRFDRIEIQGDVMRLHR